MTPGTTRSSTNHSSSKLLSKLDWDEFPFQLRLVLVGFVVAIALHYKELLRFAPNKWAVACCWMTILCGIYIARPLKERFEGLIQALANRGALEFGTVGEQEFLGNVEGIAKKSAVIFGLMWLSVLFVTYLFLVNWQKETWFAQIGLIVETAFEFATAYIIGRYCGRGLVYGALSYLLNKNRVHVKPIVGHPDETNGLKPIGEFYFYQSRIALIPVFFFAGWLLVLPLWPSINDEFIDKWYWWYFGFFMLALFGQFLVFILPTATFAQRLRREGSAMQPIVDQLSRRLIELQNEQLATSEPESVIELGEIRNRIQNQIRILEQRPALPIDPTVRKSFIIRNIGTVAGPLGAKLMQLAELL